MATASISTKGQVVIPKPFRDRLGLRPGVRVRFEEEGGAVRISPVRHRDTGATVASGLGLAGYKGPRVTEAQMKAAIRERARKRG